MKTCQTNQRRCGFTLIELLMVFAIIAILVSLLLAAIFKALGAGKDLQNRQDVASLHAAVGAFKYAYGLEYMPSTMTLKQKASSYPPGDPSLNYLTRMFPSGRFLDKFTNTGMQWGPGDDTLEGHECLVFFLGGPQSGGQPIGWSVNPDNPCDPAGERKIFYEFRKDFLKPYSGRKYLSYYDPWKQKPYAYFSTVGGIPNSYNVSGDCPSLSFVKPYGSVSGTAGVFYNPNTFQIISAGKDGSWGTSAQAGWTPTTAATIYPQGSFGADDISNFHTSKLGSTK